MIDYILLEEYGKKLNVLLVEDDDSVRFETQELLDEIFHIVKVASNGEEGLKIYNSFFEENGDFFDIVISDVHMPKIDGVELTKLIYDKNSEQEIVIISAYSNPSDLIEFINLGVSQFISKPIEIDNFINLIFNLSKKLYLSKESNSSKSKNIVTFENNIVWDKESKSLFQDGKTLKLTKKEVLLIDLLLQKKNKTSSSDEIIEHLWGDDIDIVPDITNLKNIISRLRKKVPTLIIENIYGLGYKIIYKSYE